MTKDKAENWSKRIRTARTASGLTHQALADKMGIPVQTLRNWEYGYRSPRGSFTCRVLEKEISKLEK